MQSERSGAYASSEVQALHDFFVRLNIFAIQVNKRTKYSVNGVWHQ